MNQCLCFCLILNLCLLFQPVLYAASPNVVHIIADDLGWNDVGFHGSDVQTPHLDQLAHQSIELKRFYVTPICSPTRAGVMTGRYPFRFGIWNGVVSPFKKHGLPPAEKTIAEYLSFAGYTQRAIFGKWHLGLASTLFHPLNHGFTEFYGHYNGAIDYFTRQRHGQLDWHRNYDAVQESGYSTDLIGRAAVTFIEKQSNDQPFYLLVTFNAPHSPLQAKREILDRYGYDPAGPQAQHTDANVAIRENAPEYGVGHKGNNIRQTFAAMTTAMDVQIGHILDALKQKGLEQNTILIFHSDNGADPKHGGNNSPMRGTKFTTWEGGVRVVCLIRWPEKLAAGSEHHQLAAYIDWLPTILAAAGQPIPTDVDGVNLLPALKGQLSNTERLLLLDQQTVVAKRWKLKEDELYDLQSDPQETINVAEQNADIVRELKQTRGRFMELVGPPFVSQLKKPDVWPPREWKLPQESTP